MRGAYAIWKMKRRLITSRKTPYRRLTVAEGRPRAMRAPINAPKTSPAAMVRAVEIWMWPAW